MWAKVKGSGSSRCGKFHKWKDNKPLCGLKTPIAPRTREKQPHNSCAYCVKLLAGGNWHEVHKSRVQSFNGPNCVTRIRQWGMKQTAKEV